MPGYDIVLIGASAGGVQALSEVIGGLPRDLPAAVFVVLHVSPYGRSVLPAILNRMDTLEASHAEDGEPIQPGHVYVAPPDFHLVLEDSRVCLSRGPTENGHRPAVDVLFRTAAAACGRRVVGVVLTGNLDDGTAGLAAIKQCGGVAVVQDPKEADYPGMPASAIENVAVDHVLPLCDIAPLLDRLAREPLPEGNGDSPDSALEEPNAMSTKPEDEGEAAGARDGEASGFTCPDCGGALWEKPGGPLHFRCRTGHAYSPETLLAKQADNLEGTLWAAVRALEENAALARRMEKRMREGGNVLSMNRYERRAQDAEAHADILRRVLYAEEKKVAEG
jgi:two-component system, chemotaxis family, protein-glutamate methylesterase/glutaminase